LPGAASTSAARGAAGAAAKCYTALCGPHRLSSGAASHEGRSQAERERATPSDDGEAASASRPELRSSGRQLQLRINEWPREMAQQRRDRG